MKYWLHVFYTRYNRQKNMIDILKQNFVWHTMSFLDSNGLRDFFLHVEYPMETLNFYLLYSDGAICAVQVDCWPKFGQQKFSRKIVRCSLKLFKKGNIFWFWRISENFCNCQFLTKFFDQLFLSKIGSKIACRNFTNTSSILPGGIW